MSINPIVKFIDAGEEKIGRIDIDSEQVAILEKICYNAGLITAVRTLRVFTGEKSISLCKTFIRREFSSFLNLQAERYDRYVRYENFYRENF